MAKAAATISGDFVHAERSNADGTIKEITIGKGEKCEVREQNYELNADNTKDSNMIEVKSETDYVKAMAVRDGVTVMGGGHHVIAEANRNCATGSAYGDNAKMEIQTRNAVTSFNSNCPNARGTVTVTEVPKLSKWQKLSKWLEGSDDQKALPNCEQPALQQPPEVNYNTSSVTVNGAKSQDGKADCFKGIRHSFRGSDDHKVHPNCEHPVSQPPSEIEENTSSSKKKKKKQ